MRSWRNWQTRKTKDLVGNSMQVQFLSTAPKKRTPLRCSFFCMSSVLRQELWVVDILREQNSLPYRLKYHNAWWQTEQLITVRRGAPPKAQFLSTAPKKRTPLRCSFLYEFHPPPHLHNTSGLPKAIPTIDNVRAIVALSSLYHFT